jgi:hypothetical protein
VFCIKKTKFDAEGFEGLTFYRAWKEFMITMEGLVWIIDRQYDILNSADRNFSKQICKAMFGWYICQHLCARCLAIRTYQTDMTYAEIRLLDYIRSQNYPVPSGIEKYFQSTNRNMNDKTGTEYRVEFPTWPNENGHFGSVGSDTHYMYKTMFAPNMSITRILEDPRNTINQNLDH